MRRHHQRRRATRFGPSRVNAGETDRVLDESMDYLHEVMRKKRRGRVESNAGARYPTRFHGGHGGVSRQVPQSAFRRRLHGRAERSARPLRRVEGRPHARQAHREDHRRVLGADHRGRRQLQHVPLPGTRRRAGHRRADRHLDHVHDPPGRAEDATTSRAGRRRGDASACGVWTSTPRSSGTIAQQDGQAEDRRSHFQARVPPDRGRSGRHRASRWSTSTSCSASAIPTTTRAPAAAKATWKSPRTSTTRTKSWRTWCCR